MVMGILSVCTFQIIPNISSRMTGLKLQKYVHAGYGFKLHKSCCFSFANKNSYALVLSHAIYKLEFQVTPLEPYDKFFVDVWIVWIYNVTLKIFKYIISHLKIIKKTRYFQKNGLFVPVKKCPICLSSELWIFHLR